MYGNATWISGDSPHVTYVNYSAGIGKKPKHYTWGKTLE